MSVVFSRVPKITTNWFTGYRRVLAPLALVLASLLWGELVAQKAGPLGDQLGLALTVLLGVSIALALIWLAVTAAIATAESARRDKELLRLGQLVEFSRDAIFSTRDCVILDWNAGAERLYGYTAEEVVGRSVSLLCPADRDESAELQRRVLSTGGVDDYETVRRRKDGTLIDVSISLAPIRRGDPETPPAIVEVVRQASELRRAEHEHQSQVQKIEAVGRLAGGVAHDFNNWLTAIRGYSEIMLGRLDPDDPLREYAGKINRATEGASALTRQLLAFGRKQMLHPQVLDLNAVAAGLVDVLQSLVGEEVEVVIEADPCLERVRADRNQIEQVILNLAINAKDAMPSGGRLTISTGVRVAEELGRCVTLSVADTGVGISPGVRARLFEPFFTTKGGIGTGLGLSTAHGIVSQSGGTIAVDSALGTGSVFTVSLPSVGLLASSAQAAPEPPENLVGDETILLVEDKVDTRSAVATLIRGQGYRVLEATDGRDALRVAGGYDGAIHLVVTDVVMPRMTGPQLAEHLAAVRPEAGVLYVSGYAGSEMAFRGVARADVRFLAKPFGKDVLLRKMREVLDARSRAA